MTQKALCCCVYPDAMVQIARNRRQSNDKRVEEKTFCACGCDQLIQRYDKWGKERRFKLGHGVPKGANSRRWKGAEQDMVMDMFMSMLLTIHIEISITRYLNTALLWSSI